MLSAIFIVTLACESEAEKYYNDAVVYKEQGMDFEALKAIEMTIGIEPNDAEFYMKRADFYSEYGFSEPAIADYNEAIHLKPDAALYTKRGKAYIRMGIMEMNNWENAIEDFSEAIRLDPKLAEAYIWRGKTYHSWASYELISEAHSYQMLSQEALERYEQAVKDITEAIRLEPAASYHATRALVYEDMEQYDKAITDYTEAIRLEPEALYFNNRGLLYYVTSHFEQAIKDFDNSIHLIPDNYEAYLFRGIVCSELGRYEQVIEDLNKAIEFLPFRDIYPLDYIYILRANANIELGQYDMATEDYHEAISIDSSLADYDTWLKNDNNSYVPEIYQFYFNGPEIAEKVRQALEENQ